MKRYQSVFEMITRSSIYKVLLVVGGMLVAEAILFWNALMYLGGACLEEHIDQSYYSIVFKIAYVLITIAIVFPGMNIGSTQTYTLQRLRIKERWIYGLQIIYNLLAYMILWGAQLAMLLVSAVLYQKYLPKGALWTNQTLFIAFYRNDFMHSILPLEDGPSWWVLGLIGVSTAILTAEFTKQQRNGKFVFELLGLMVTAIIVFPREMGFEFVFLVIVLVFVYITMIIRRLLQMEVKES